MENDIKEFSAEYPFDYFWATTVKKLFDLQKVQREASVKVESYVNSSYRLSAIRELGFEVAVLENYIMFYKEPFSSLHGCTFSPQAGFNFCGWTMPTNEEIKKLKAIMNPPVVYDNLSEEELELGLSRPL